MPLSHVQARVCFFFFFEFFICQAMWILKSSWRWPWKIQCFREYCRFHHAGGIFLWSDVWYVMAENFFVPFMSWQRMINKLLRFYKVWKNVCQVIAFPEPQVDQKNGKDKKLQLLSLSPLQDMLAPKDCSNLPCLLQSSFKNLYSRQFRGRTDKVNELLFACSGENHESVTLVRKWFKKKTC